MRLNKIILLATLPFILFSCSEEKVKDESPKGFVVNDSMYTTMSFGDVILDSVHQALKLTGKVGFNEEQTSKIYPIASGRIVSLKVELGDYVQKGQVLAVIKSGEAADIESDLASTRSRLVIAEKNRNVAKDMFADGLISQKDYTSAEKEFQIVETELKKLEEKLSIFNISGTSTYTVFSPISGFLVEKKVTQDFLIRNDYNDYLFTVSNISDVWVYANLYEVDINKVQPGARVEISTIAYPDKLYQGTVDKIYNVVDPATRIIRVRIKLHNPDYLLKPEMFARVKVFYSIPEKKISIPSKAILFDANKYYVLVYRDRSHIDIREVTQIGEFQDRTYVEANLKPGEKVVTANQLLIYEQIKD